MGYIDSHEVVDFEGSPVGVVRFREPMEVISSAVLNGGSRITSTYFIMQVPKDYCTDDPSADAARVRDGLGLPEDAVGMMTAAEVDYVFNVRTSVFNGVEMEAVATAGLSNHVVAGEVLDNWDERHAISLERGKKMMAGTINIGVVSTLPLTPEAKINLMIPLVEAKTAALMDFGYRETGTTSDSMAVFSPIGEDRCAYTGTGSDPGLAAARAVRAAVGYALRRRLEHPVPERAVRILGGLGYTERLLSALASAGVPEEDADRRLGEFLEREDVLNAVDFFYFTANRVDRLADDGNLNAYGMLGAVSKELFDQELPRRPNVMDAFVEVLAAEIKKGV